MKVALIFSGQVRELPIDFFRDGLRLLTEGVDCKIFLNYWDEMGKSMNHNLRNRNFKNKLSSDYIVEKMFSDFHLSGIIHEPYENFVENIPADHFKIHRSNKNSIDCHSLPQIYSFCKLFNTFENELKNFDLILRCRFDSIFTHKLIETELIKSTPKDIFHINYGVGYYPNRIYDVFFGGSYYAIKILANTWEIIPELVSDKFDNGLNKIASPRLLYLNALKNNLNIISLSKRLCDVCRKKERKYYVSFIAGAGIAKRSLNLIKILNAWKIFFFWGHYYGKINKYFLIKLIFIDFVFCIGLNKILFFIIMKYKLLTKKIK